MMYCRRGGSTASDRMVNTSYLVRISLDGNVIDAVIRCQIEKLMPVAVDIPSLAGGAFPEALRAGREIVLRYSLLEHPLWSMP